MMFESSSQFDATAAFSGGGGGFVSSQSTDPSSTSAKSRDTQPMYPVTVKQIIEASPSSDDKSNFLIDGVDVYNVKLVGMVFDKSERVTDVSFVIDDGTGRIRGNRWINDAQDTEEVQGLMDGIYVRVHGHLRSFQGKKQVAVYAIRPVNDYNEIANHFLECVHAHCCNTRLQIQNSGSASASLAVSTASGHQAVSSSQVTREYNLDGLGGLDKMVLDYLQLPSSIAQEKGVHRNEIAQKLKISQEKIIETMESLESEGLVYSTIDEFHYKSTAS
ncbi:Single-stranded DNA-binding replication protein A (RPA), medium (30 kD) subunit [Handroanthus impetiginosus]|uniref:Single-stranded DNA-binding replication protein A (RPA), medium (30 kD) subunit n=1 Tax=Handroanthus impetiginosus TaxID=429701 RepID=A0A2G9H5V0_9LAMI|nr:Single-stranded DNA-binding replication protein A (RPA), medium (30 kD) subunit [Handroanthus impetiginosus]